MFVFMFFIYYYYLLFMFFYVSIYTCEVTFKQSIYLHKPTFKSLRLLHSYVILIVYIYCIVCIDVLHFAASAIVLLNESDIFVSCNLSSVKYVIFCRIFISKIIIIILKAFSQENMYPLYIKQSSKTDTNNI